MSKYQTAEQLHNRVPPDWYFKSIRHNPLQKYWHSKRFETIKRLSKDVKGGKVLDIGSADGVFTREILEATKADEVIGIDVLENSVDWANNHWKRNKKMKFQVANAHKLPFKAKIFDAVFALEVLEHLHNPESVFKEIKRVLKNGGYAVFLVPTDVVWFKLGWDFIWTKTRGKIWNDTHIQSFTNDELIKASKKAGFEIEESNKFLLKMLHAVRVRNK